MITTDLTKFGSRERKMAKKLLKAWREQGMLKDFHNNEVAVVVNTRSGSVFLVSAECDVVMMNGDILERVHACPYCGYKGFLRMKNRVLLK